MLLKVEYRTKKGFELSVPKPIYINTRENLIKEFAFLKKKYSAFSFKSQNIFLQDGSIKIHLKFKVFDDEQLLFGTASKIEDFKVYKKRLVCSNCKTKIQDWFDLFNQKLPKKTKDLIGMSCGKCTPVGGVFIYNLSDD